MQDRREESSPSPRRRNHLPHIAPRADQRTSPARDRASASSSGRPPRLSHRSRAGCWTCRGRKVKCDELKPRCGPCTRLNRDCDWDHRWNFNDSTSSTQGKHTNVTTAGNVVWDPSAQSSPNLSPRSPTYDDLPAFATLIDDESRERKAETHKPGTFSVVATPESFAHLKEYAATASQDERRGSTQSGHGSIGSPVSSHSITIRPSDPNTVLLERFEDPSSPSGPVYPPVVPSPRKRSVDTTFERLTISTAPPTSAISGTAAPSQGGSGPDGVYTEHFRRYIAPRLVPLGSSFQAGASPGSTTDIVLAEAARFPPLYHAVCAISALNLSYKGRASLEEALQHYQNALSVTSTPTSPESLLSDGVFLRHFLLFIYDICADGGDDMWAQHLTHLRTIAVQRHQHFGHEPYSYILWAVCGLDMYACLLGHGTCEFIRTVVQNGMLTPLPLQLSGPVQPHEAQLYPLIQRLNENVIIQTSKMAELAQRCRAEAASGRTSPGSHARWQASVSKLQTDLATVWNQSYPDVLGPESPQAGSNLPFRLRSIFEHAFLLYQASTIYSRTSMFPGQRTIPLANQGDIHADTERRCIAILTLTGKALESDPALLNIQRHVVFPLFMAGVATSQPDAKIQAINIIKGLEKGGIGLNTHQTRQLLVAVMEEQRKVASFGGRIEQVDWLQLARERHLTVVNCG